MKKSRRLRPVAKFAHQRERDAARTLGESLRQLDQQKKQLDGLIQYRDQYVAGFQAAGKDGLTAVQLRDYQLFLNRLDAAIEQQQQKLAASRQNRDLNQAEWQDKHGHSKMINKVIEHRQQEENREREQQEQREQDDRPQSASDAVEGDS